MRGSDRAIELIVWVAGMLGMAIASFFLWVVGGTAICGEETYNTPPGSLGDDLCKALVDPVVPWALIAAVPYVLAAVGGFFAVRRGSRTLLLGCLATSFVLFAGASFALLAAF